MQRHRCGGSSVVRSVELAEKKMGMCSAFLMALKDRGVSKCRSTELLVYL